MVRDRFLKVLNFEQQLDRLPVIEWATWWDKTLDEWHLAGLPSEYGVNDDRLWDYFHLDPHKQFWLKHHTNEFPEPEYHGAAIIKDESGYEGILQTLYPADCVELIREQLLSYKRKQDKDEMAIWMTLEGYFWFPRTLFGIEGHLYSFYDHPELYHRICSDLCDFQLKMIDEFCNICVPDFMTIAEDMSYNGGPMLSEEMFDEFILPYYKKIIPALKKHGVKVFVDTDGDVTMLIDWLIRSGVEGICPLERRSGVDIFAIKKKYPQLLMFGGYDKTVMSKGEAAMRREFERILPVMKMGGYIPSVDHQTPPNVSLEDYRIYVSLLTEYAAKAVR